MESPRCPSFARSMSRADAGPGSTSAVPPSPSSRQEAIICSCPRYSRSICVVFGATFSNGERVLFGSTALMAPVLPAAVDGDVGPKRTLSPLENVAPNTTQIDLEYLGQLQMIASCLLEGEGGTALVDPGPASALDMLRAKLGQRGLSIADVDHLVLTHIHLDPAGATGTLVRENPRIRVWVHERGAPHLIDPARLIESATRLYGAKMNLLWGEILPVPAGNVQALSGSERIRVGG